MGDERVDAGEEPAIEEEAEPASDTDRAPPPRAGSTPPPIPASALVPARLPRAGSVPPPPPLRGGSGRPPPPLRGGSVPAPPPRARPSAVPQALPKRPERAEPAPGASPRSGAELEETLREFETRIAPLCARAELERSVGPLRRRIDELSEQQRLLGDLSGLEAELRDKLPRMIRDEARIWLEALTRRLEELSARADDVAGAIATLRFRLGSLEQSASPPASEAASGEGLEEALQARDARIAILEARIERIEAARDEARGAPARPIREAEPRDAGGDLRKIKGIGPKFERILRAHGIREVATIAAWTEAEIEHFAAALGIKPERIAKADWVGSARRLRDGGC